MPLASVLHFTSIYGTPPAAGGVPPRPAIRARARVEDGELNEADDHTLQFGYQDDAVRLVEQVVDVALPTCRLVEVIEVVGKGVPVEDVGLVEQADQRIHVT